MSDRAQFGRLRASTLFCADCKQATPVRERLLLVLPEKEIYEYLCTECSASVGRREVSAAQQVMRREAAGNGRQVRIL